MAEALVIDCDECVMRHTASCNDCIMTALCERSDDGPVAFDDIESHAVHLLSSAGLVPRLRLQKPV